MNNLPRTARAIVKLAEGNQWAIDINAYPNGDAALRFRRPGVDVRAFWIEGRWDSGVVRHPVLLPLRQKDLKNLLATPVEEFGFDEWPPDLDDDPKQKIKDEYEMCGYYISGHPLDYVNMGKYPDVVPTTTLDEEWCHPESTIQVLGIVEEPRVIRTRNGNWMAFFGVSDLAGFAQCVGFGEEYKGMKAGMLVHVKGVVDERDGQMQIRARNVREVEW